MSCETLFTVIITACFHVNQGQRDAEPLIRSLPPASQVFYCITGSFMGSENVTIFDKGLFHALTCTCASSEIQCC